jgi:branched-chain amino acid transport system substrate-binding protein
VVAVERARAAALAGRPEDARRVATSLLDRGLDAIDRHELRRVLDGEIEPLGSPLRIGVVLSLTGRFERVGEQLQDGIELAFREREAAGSGPAVELVVLDDSSSVERGVDLARRLAEEGVVAVIGPIRSEVLLGAAAARPYAGLLILSPTASADSGSGPNAGSLWERSRREAGIGAALGRWLPARLGLRRLAALHPDDAGGLAGVTAFERAGAEWGAEVVAVRAYDPDSTTFAEPITAVAAADPEAVLVLTDASRTVLQIAPQLVYYGLRSRVIAGGENWSDPDVLRQLDSTFSDFRVVATYLDRTAEGSAWERFRSSYERTFLRGLPETLLPALGYDAAGLVLAAIPEDALPRPGALSRRLRALGSWEGATGLLRFDAPVPGVAEASAEGDAGEGVLRVRREVFVRMVRDGALVEADPAAIAAWAEAAREQEERLRELEEEKQKREEERRQADGTIP